MHRATIIVPFLFANRLKLVKMIVSQEISTTRKGMGSEWPALVNSSRRVLPRSALALNAMVLR